MGKLKPEVHFTTMERKVWGPDDEYHTVEVQVNSMGEWPEGQHVKVTVEPISKGEFEKYFREGIRK